MKRNVIFALYIVAGIIIGSLIAAFAPLIPWLAWLAFGPNLSFAAENPAVLDLSILRIAFGISLTITVAHVICIAVAVFIFYRSKK